MSKEIDVSFLMHKGANNVSYKFLGSGGFGVVVQGHYRGMEIDFYESDITDDEEFLEILPRRAPRTYRQRINHFERWSETEFLHRFRFSKNAVCLLLEMIEHSIKAKTTRNHAVSAELKLLLTLRYFATGSFLAVCGDFRGVHKTTASVIVRQVSPTIAGLRSDFIKFPTTNKEKDEIYTDFFNGAKFPNCIGAFDCTHVKIQSPGGDNAEIFRNRKGYFSINVQTICDASLKINNIVARWPGSAHDSNIFRNSRIRASFERGHMGNSVLVADSGYAVSHYLLTKINEPQTQGEQLYNESLTRTRIVVERSYGVWKRRFPILSKGINLKLDRVEAIIIATAVLHNFACNFKIAMPDAEDDDHDMLNNLPDNEQVGMGNDAVRRAYVRYFTTLI